MLEEALGARSPGHRQVIGDRRRGRRRQEPPVRGVRASAVGRSGIPVYHIAGQAHAQSIPLLPVLEIMRAYFDIAELDSEQTARERIAGKLLLLDQSFAEDLPLMFDFLAVPDPERPSPRMDPEARQRQLLEPYEAPRPCPERARAWHHGVRGPALARPRERGLPRATTSRRPGNAGADCCSTSGPSTRPRGCRSPTTARSRWRRSTRRRSSRCSGICSARDPSLDGLPRTHPRAHRRQPVLHRGDRAVADRGGQPRGRARQPTRLVGAVEAAAIPASVQAVISARIDRLGEREKAVLQAAAVIGKEFPARCSPESPGTSRRARGGAAALVAGEFVFEQELYPEAVYAFKHPLTQEVAYRSQLGRRRAPCTRRSPGDRGARSGPLDERAALLAHHWETAGQSFEAARWNARAGAWAGRRTRGRRCGTGGEVRELTDLGRLRRDGRARALGADLLPHLRVAPRHLSRRVGDVLQPGRADGLTRATSGLARSCSRSTAGSGGATRAASRVRQAGPPCHRPGGGIRRPCALMIVFRLVVRLFLVGELGEAVTVLDRAMESRRRRPDGRRGDLRRLPARLLLVFKGGVWATRAGSRMDAS